MSKPIRSYPKGQQAQVITRRLAGQTGGLGYILALGAKAILDAKEKAKADVISEEVK